MKIELDVSPDISFSQHSFPGNTLFIKYIKLFYIAGYISLITEQML